MTTAGDLFIIIIMWASMTMLMTGNRIVETWLMLLTTQLKLIIGICIIVYQQPVVH